MAKKKADIHIKKKNVGKFTAWCKAHGHSGANATCIAHAKREAKRTGNKALMKMAVFAQNAKKWDWHEL